MTLALPVAAIILGIVSLAITVINNNGTVRRSYVEKLERRIVDLERQLAATIQERDAKEQENIRLLKLLMAGGE